MGKAGRMAEVIGADRVLRATAAQTNEKPVHAALLAELYLPEMCLGPFRDCGRMTGNPQLIPGIGFLLTSGAKCEQQLPL